MQLPLKNNVLAGKVENRREKRETVFLSGRIIVIPDTVYKCIIHDTAPSGAMIELEEEAQLPATFILKILDYDKSVRCRLVWQNETKLGVQFIRDKLR